LTASNGKARKGQGFRARNPAPGFADSAGAGGEAPSRAPSPELDRDPDPAAVARSIVLRQLTNSPKSRLQLAETVLDRFEEVRLIDDADFADMWVRSRSQTRKLAKGALRRELADKGIDPDTAAGALEQLSDEDEEAAARELVQRKLRGTSDLTDRAERDKITRRLASMLARKGYQPSQAFRIVGEVLDAAAGRAES
jgi:regulatory protein